MIDRSIHFEKRELEFLGDKEVWELRKRTGEKVFGLLEELREALEALPIHENKLPLDELELKAAAPKISRGENYKGKPYMVLDMPRIFG